MSLTPIIIPNYNQLHYTRNLVQWWKWYYPQNPVIIIDNGSDYKPLLEWYKSGIQCEIVICEENDFVKNLRSFLDDYNDSEYYVISDPDLQPHPSTPPNFLEIFEHLLKHHNYHHAGFGLVWEDIPDWNTEKTFIQNNERQFEAPEGNGQMYLRNKNTGQLARQIHGEQAISFAQRNPGLYELVSNDTSRLFAFEFGGQEYSGWNAPIDTTFAMYSTQNSGWAAPMPGDDWNNSIRIFKAFHYPWYQSPNYINSEMRHYFTTARYWEAGEPSAGVNHNRPSQFIKA